MSVHYPSNFQLFEGPFQFFFPWALAQIYLSCQMEYFRNLLDLFHDSIWENAHRACFKRGETKLGSWLVELPVCHLQADHTDSLLLALAGRYRLRLPVGARSDIRRVMWLHDMESILIRFFDWLWNSFKTNTEWKHSPVEFFKVDELDFRVEIVLVQLLRKVASR